MFVYLLLTPTRGFVIFDKEKKTTKQCMCKSLVYANLLLHIVTKYKIQLNLAVYQPPCILG